MAGVLAASLFSWIFTIQCLSFLTRQAPRKEPACPTIAVALQKGVKRPTHMYSRLPSTIPTVPTCPDICSL